VTVTVRADRAAEAVALLTALLDAGCRERPLYDGRVSLDFWSEDAEDRERIAVTLDREGIPAEVASAAEHVDWKARMEEFHRPRRVGELYLRPPWEPAAADAHDVVVDPGMAFGTGQHPTTRGCLELLHGRPRGSVLDAGCGSGVLAIAACRLGHDPVWAIDDDPEAIAATRHNARANHVAMRISRLRIGEQRLPAVDGVLANLTASMMEPLRDSLRPAPPQWAILSGLRTFESAAAEAAFADLGLTVASRREEGRWASLLLTR
jgi:ribosomal protein L11 methyltransferase